MKNHRLITNTLTRLGVLALNMPADDVAREFVTLGWAGLDYDGADRLVNERYGDLSRDLRIAENLVNRVLHATFEADDDEPPAELTALTAGLVGELELMEGAAQISTPSDRGGFANRLARLDEESDRLLAALSTRPELVASCTAPLIDIGAAWLKALPADLTGRRHRLAHGDAHHRFLAAAAADQLALTDGGSANG